MLAQKTQMGTPVSFAHLKELFESTRDPAQDDGTSENNKHCNREMTPASHSAAQKEAEKKKMWAEYMKEAEKYDSRAAEGWTKDADGLLVFVRPNFFPLFVAITGWKTGLFSATVGAFIIEFYKKLSPDGGDRTVALLCQISQQFPNFTNGTCSPPEPDQSFSPSAPVIWANAMWMMSLILSLTSALFATLLQQWARRYVETPQISSEPRQRARVRSYLFFGTRKYRMRTAVETAPTLLHVSVFLFLAGLVPLFFTINKTVAIIVSISVGIFVVAYVALTILPYTNHNCPYRTPMSNVWWYTSHLSLFSVFFCFHRLFRQLHGRLVRPNLGGVVSNTQRILVSGLKIFEGAVNKHRTRLKDGFGRTIMQRHFRASDNMDLEALTWWLKQPALSEESQAQDFLACLPKETIVQLMYDRSRKFIFSGHLYTLLRSFGPGLLAVGLEENERKARLLVYLRAIHCITYDFVNHRFVSQYSEDDVNFVRSRFAEISHMQVMWTDSDTGIRVTSRCICALLARCLLHRGLPGASDLAWLQNVIGESSDTIFDSNKPQRDRMNLKAFVHGVLAHNGGDLPTEHATSFTETLAILMTPEAEVQSSFDRTRFQIRLTDLVRQIEQDAAPGSAELEVVERLRRTFEDFLTPPVPGAAQQS
jgi:hypothetical protein